MDIGDIKYLEAPAKVRKLSDSIRIGCLTTGATKEIGEIVWYRERGNRCFACLIGAAWIGSGKDIHKRYGVIGVDWLTREFGIPGCVGDRAHLMYEYEGKTREEIADWLESQGY